MLADALGLSYAITHLFGRHVDDTLLCQLADGVVMRCHLLLDVIGKIAFHPLVDGMSMFHA